MITNTCTSFKERKLLKKNKSVNIQAVLHTNNATVGAQNRENKIFKIKMHSNRNPTHFIATLKKRGEEGELSSRFVSLNTMQQN